MFFSQKCSLNKLISTYFLIILKLFILNLKLEMNSKLNSIKKSSTLIILSSIENKVDRFDYKVLLLKRSKNMRVLPGFHAFPGGKLDENADASPKWLEVFFDTKQLNECKSDPYKIKNIFKGFIKNDYSELPQKTEDVDVKIPIEISQRICALRETFEETGILLAQKRDQKNCPSKSASSLIFENINWVKEWQSKVKNDPNNFLDIFIENNLIPEISGLYKWAHWITPTIEKFRFDTTFFICFLPEIPCENSLSLDKEENENIEVIN